MSAFRIPVALLCAAGLVSFLSSPTLAQKSKPGGGGGTTTPARYAVIELPAMSVRAYQVTNVDSQGFVTVVGEGAESGYVTAAVARVHVATRAVTSSLLPEPTDGMLLDADSNAHDINAQGIIVGSASVFEGPIDNNHRISKPARWLPDASAPTGYRHQQLPLLSGHRYGSVQEINDTGWMVGFCQTEVSGQTTLWSPSDANPRALQSVLPPDSGWSELSVEDINNENEIVGTGLFDGVLTGFMMVLYFNDDQELISTITPLIAPPGVDRIYPVDISDTGEIVGIAVVADGLDMATYQVNSEADVEFLPSATPGSAEALQRNSHDMVVGNSLMPDNPTSSLRWVGTLWEPTAIGGFTAAALDKLVPTKPEWRMTLTFSINEQGCIASYGRKYDKGKYTWTCVLLVPNS